MKRVLLFGLLFAAPALLPATLLPATLLPATLLPATLLPATLLPATLLPAIAPLEGALVMDLENKENVVASRLIGEWKLSAAINQKLQVTSTTPATITFTADAAAIPPEVLEKLAGRMKEKKLKGDLTVYLVGKLKLDTTVYPAFLTNLNGNPHLVMFREKRGYAFGDTESCNVMVATAKDRAGDLLFFGGDFNNQPFRAFERK
jgi:hypothetical protein